VIETIAALRCVFLFKILKSYIKYPLALLILKDIALFELAEKEGLVSPD